MGQVNTPLPVVSSMATVLRSFRGRLLESAAVVPGSACQAMMMSFLEDSKCDQAGGRDYSKAWNATSLLTIVGNHVTGSDGCGRG